MDEMPKEWMVFDYATKSFVPSDVNVQVVPQDNWKIISSFFEHPKQLQLLKTAEMTFIDTSVTAL